MEQSKYGVLLNQNAKLHRAYFNEMVRLLGIQVVYRSPKPDKHYTTYSEIDANFEPPILLGCIFEEHPNQATMKKLGWVSSLQENSSVIFVPYDTPNIQRGSLFIVPSGIDGAKGRVFRLESMEVDIIYPSSIACTIVPEYEDTYNEQDYDYSKSSFNLLSTDESEDHLWFY